MWNINPLTLPKLLVWKVNVLFFNSNYKIIYNTVRSIKSRASFCVKMLFLWHQTWQEFRRKVCLKQLTLYICLKHIQSNLIDIFKTFCCSILKQHLSTKEKGKWRCMLCPSWRRETLLKLSRFSSSFISKKFYLRFFHYKNNEGVFR